MPGHKLFIHGKFSNTSKAFDNEEQFFANSKEVTSLDAFPK